MPDGSFSIPLQLDARFKVLNRQVEVFYACENGVGLASVEKKIAVQSFNERISGCFEALYVFQADVIMVDCFLILAQMMVALASEVVTHTQPTLL